MATYNFDSEEKQYFLLSDVLKGLMIALDDGVANFVYVKGEGYVEDPALLDYVWPNSPKFGQARNITEQEAIAFAAELEAGKMPFDAYTSVFGEEVPIKKGQKVATWEEMEQNVSPIGEGMTMDELFAAWQNLIAKE